ncbi:MAG: SDR family oxidoreductase [Clostridia bacterium]|nr:SDR family oxidoreductase [Deltaproteobacteria bacterium]
MKRIVLVTGGGRDIGRGIVERLSRTHAGVAIHANASVAAAQELAVQLEKSGVKAKAFAADLAKPSDITRLFAGFDSWKKTLGDDFVFTTLVNNSAIAAASPIASTEAATIDALIDVNLKGTYRVTAEAARRLSDGGRIVSVTLDAHAVFSPDYSLFTATKVALDALTRHWAVGLGSRGITVNAVAPGVVDANFRTAMLQDQAFRVALESVTALARTGTIDDVVGVVDFLTTDAARWVTGQVIATSGGWKL